MVARGPLGDKLVGTVRAIRMIRAHEGQLIGHRLAAVARGHRPMMPGVSGLYPGVQGYPSVRATWTLRSSLVNRASCSVKRRSGPQSTALGGSSDQRMEPVRGVRHPAGPKVQRPVSTAWIDERLTPVDRGADDGRGQAAGLQAVGASTRGAYRPSARRRSWTGVAFSVQVEPSSRSTWTAAGRPMPFRASVRTAWTSRQSTCIAGTCLKRRLKADGSHLIPRGPIVTPPPIHPFVASSRCIRSTDGANLGTVLRSSTCWLEEDPNPSELRAMALRLRCAAHPTAKPIAGTSTIAATCTARQPPLV